MGWSRSYIADKIWNLFENQIPLCEKSYYAKRFLELLENDMDFDTGDECDFVRNYLKFNEEREEWVP